MMDSMTIHNLLLVSMQVLYLLTLDFNKVILVLA